MMDPGTAIAIGIAWLIAICFILAILVGSDPSPGV